MNAKELITESMFMLNQVTMEAESVFALLEELDSEEGSCVIQIALHYPLILLCI